MEGVLNIHGEKAFEERRDERSLDSIAPCSESN